MPKDKSVAGYFTRVEQVGERHYAVIETHADPTKGVRYFIPYEKQFDHLQMHHFMVYDGKQMKEVSQKDLREGTEYCPGTVREAGANT